MKKEVQLSERFTRHLPVEMSEKDLLGLGSELADLLGRHRREQDEEDLRRKEWNTDHKEQMVIIHDAAAELKRGTRSEPVECIGEVHGDDYNVTRMDTGEVIECRQATDMDRQRVLDLEPAKT